MNAVNDQNASLLANYFTNSYNNLIIQHFPQKTLQLRKHPLRWFNNNILEMRNMLTSLRIIYDCTKDNTDKIRYSTFKKHYQKQISLAKKNAFENFIRNSNNLSRDCWRIVNHERSKNRRESPGNCPSPETFA